MTRALPTWPVFDAEVANRVAQILRSGQVNYWTGKEGRKFEAEFAAFTETKHCIACTNGSAALDLCLEALGIGSAYGGTILDEVIVTPRSFIASAAAIVRAGARVVFADVDPVSQNITPRSVRPRINDNTRAIICVHLAGWPCDMDGFRKLTETRGIPLIEDCAQAHGAQFQGRSVGGLGTIAAWSFCQDKIMSTGGEGGAISTDDNALAARIWALKDHGKSKTLLFQKPPPQGEFRYVHDQIGTNARMTEIQAAIGRHQISKIKDWTTKRSENAQAIEHALADFAGPDGPIRLTSFDTSDGSNHAYYKYYAFLRPENLRLGYSRKALTAAFSEKGIIMQAGICPEIYREAAFQKLYKGPRLPIAKLLGETSIMLQVHPTLRAEDIDYITTHIRTIFGQSTKLRYSKIA
ncbi:MAG: DegT/DnrJ/EryC1/StrS aminotransferase family protein [Pseudomonadota bacterium]